MQKLFLSLALLFIGISASFAQVAVPSGFMGINYGGNASGLTAPPFYPNAASVGRLWDSSYGATFHATQWATLNPSSGVYNFTTDLDPVLTTLASYGLPTEWTAAQVPSWVNGSQALSGAQITSYTTFLSAMMSHVAANKQCFWGAEEWNEAQNGTTWWTGTDVNQMLVDAQSYPIIKAACPQTLVLSPSVTVAGGNVNPAAYQSSFAQWENVLGACSGPCWDALSYHTYVAFGGVPNNDPTIQYAPELVRNVDTQVKTIANATGNGSLAIYATEGWAGATNTGFNVNGHAWGSALADMTLIISSDGIQKFLPFSFGPGCTSLGPDCVSLWASNGTPLPGLSYPGLAMRSVTNWLSGATWTSPLARVTGANLVRTPPNGAGVATGLLAGAGGCAGAPTGTGSLPTNWGHFDADAGAGMSEYVVGSGTTTGGRPYVDVRFCGTDTTPGSGTAVDEIQFDTNVPAVQNNQLVYGSCWAVTSGSLINVSTGVLDVDENNGGSYLTTAQMKYLLPTSDSADNQCYSGRYIVEQATTTRVVPYFALTHFYNSTTPLPVDVTIRIAAPDAEIGSTQWKGVLTKAGGYQATVLWDSSGQGSTTAPAGSVDYRDLYGNVYPATPEATIALTGSALLIENQTAKFAFPPL